MMPSGISSSFLLAPIRCSRILLKLAQYTISASSRSVYSLVNLLLVYYRVLVSCYSVPQIFLLLNSVFRVNFLQTFFVFVDFSRWRTQVARGVVSHRLILLLALSVELLNRDPDRMRMIYAPSVGFALGPTRARFARDGLPMIGMESQRGCTVIPPVVIRYGAVLRNPLAD